MASRFIAGISGAFSALLTAAAVVVASPANATPPLPPTPAITPGAGIVTANASRTDGGTCTAGWLAHTRNGRPVLLSAGHCDHGGPVSIKWTDTGKYETIGSFATSIRPGSDPENSDFGVIALDSNIPSDARVLDRRPVEGVTTGVHVGDLLCKYGNTTGRSCGRVLDKPTDNKVQFDTESREGDSGGPVYLIQPNGDAVAVGIDVGHTDTGRAVAELVQPWLHKLGLTLDTTDGGTAQPARYGR
jgi:hypothetical protein